MYPCYQACLAHLDFTVLSVRLENARSSTWTMMRLQPQWTQRKNWELTQLLCQVYAWLFLMDWSTIVYGYEYCCNLLLHIYIYIYGKYNIDHTYRQIHFVETYEEGKQYFNFGGYQENVKRETIWKNDANNNGIVLRYIFSNISSKKGKNI